MRINKISIFILSLWLRCLKIYNIFLCIQVITVFKSGSAASLCSLFMHTEAICGKVIIMVSLVNISHPKSNMPGNATVCHFS